MPGEAMAPCFLCLYSEDHFLFVCLFVCLFVYAACGCSNLSMSDSCHAETGACECQVGAVGLKCDDCAFGFTGQCKKKKKKKIK